MQSHTADSSAELHAAANVCLSDCRYVEGHDLDDSFKWLRQTWSEQVGSDRERERKRVQWLSAVKEATRQALQVCFPISLAEAAQHCCISDGAQERGVALMC